MHYRLFIVISFVVIAFSFVAKSTLAAPGNTGIPGWGHGDTNHVHVGPPGQSDRPDFNENRIKKYKQSKLYKLIHSKGSLKELIELLIQRRSH